MSDAPSATADPNPPTVPPTGGIPGAAPAPTHAGRYEILDEIARGGMGVVYRATDPVLGREVAVKLLQDRFGPASVAASRFEDEGRITGQLQHPGIPAVHDLGTLPDGRPFLAMKLVKGRTLDKLLGDPGALNLVAVFEQVCQAVGYAHAHRVIHRDLKPANVMIGAFGEVQVMDWGLAKVLTGRGASDPGPDPDTTLGTEIRSLRDAADGTHAGSLLGTPAYMPPEQAIGAIDQVDERSDVFGLGAVLCAVLTGKPPYVGADTESTRQLAARAKLDDAFARLEACGAEPGLVALCKRCLSPEKADRPADAGEVAKAVAELRAAAEERARQAELERVRAEGERARAEAEAREQRKRRRAQLAMAAAIGLLVLGGVAFAWWQDRYTRGERERLERNADAVAALLGQCEDALQADDAERARLAFAQAEERASEGGTDHLADRFERCRADLAMLRELDAIDTFRWFVVDNKRPDRKDVVARWKAALAGYGVVPGEAPAAESAALIIDSHLRHRLVATLDLWLAFDPSAVVRDVLRAADQNTYRDAVREAIVTGDGKRVGELAEQPEAVTQPPGFAAALGHRAAVPLQRRREVLELALRSRPGNLTLLMTLGGTYPIGRRAGADERLRWYQAAVAAEPRSVPAYNGLGIALTDRGERYAAIAAYRKVILLDPTYAPGHNNLANALAANGDLDEAIAAYKEVIRLIPSSPIYHRNLGLALAKKKDQDGAIAAYREALRLDPKYLHAHNNLREALKAKFGPDAAVEEYRWAARVNPKDASAHDNLGNALRDRKDLDGAIAAYRKATQIDAKLIRAHANLGHALKAKGDLDGAIAAFWAAIRHSPNYPGEAPLYQLILCHIARGDPEAAVKAAREAIRLFPTAYHPHHVLGDVLQFHVKDSVAAAAAYRKSISLNPIHAWSNNNLGIALQNSGDLDGAIVRFREALRLDPRHPYAHGNLRGALKAKFGQDAVVEEYREAIRLNPKDASAHKMLGDALRDRNNLSEAVAAYKEAIRLNRNFVEAHTFLSVTYRRTGQWDDATAAAREAVRHGPKSAPAHTALAEALTGKGDLDKAREAARIAVRLDPKFPWAHLADGDILQARGNRKGAVAAYRQATLLAPNDTFFHRKLADALREQKDYDGAIAAYQAHIRLNPNANVYHQMLQCYAAKNDPDGAVKAAREAVRLFPTAHLPHVALGDALHFNKKDAAAAVAAYREAIRLNPSFAISHFNLGRALQEMGDRDGAIRSFREAVRLDPKNATMHVTLGDALKNKGNTAGAIAAYKEAIRLNPKDSHLRFTLGHALKDKGDLNGAVASFREAIQLDPKRAYFHNNLGLVLREKGDLNGAIGCYKEAIRLDPKLARAHTNLGVALRDKGDLHAAITAFKEAVRLAPQNGMFRYLLARLLATGPDGVRDGRLAVELATRACELSEWKYAGWIDTLAAACAEVGDFDKAVGYQKKALAVSFPAWEKGEGKDARQRLELYSQKKPYRDPVLAARKPDSPGETKRP